LRDGKEGEVGLEDAWILSRFQRKVEDAWILSRFQRKVEEGRELDGRVGVVVETQDRHVAARDDEVEGDDFVERDRAIERSERVGLDGNTERRTSQCGHMGRLHRQ
jgi:hypothetical protein